MAPPGQMSLRVVACGCRSNSGMGLEMNNRKRKIHKGDYGYLRHRRLCTALIVAGLLAVALCLYFGALAHFGTNQNWFTIFAVLVCLPAAREIVNLVMLLKAHGCTEQTHTVLEEQGYRVPAAYDLYMTSEKKNFDLSHLAYAGGSIIALTEDPKCDCRAGEQHIRRILQQNNFHGYTVKIFDSLKPYLTRLSQLDENAAAMDEDTAAALRQLLLTISL